MQARIYQPPKSAMTSGRGNSKFWVLEYAPDGRKVIDPLMGWTGSGDMNGQVRLRFETRDVAENYAKRRNLDYRVETPQHRRVNLRPMGYAGNFAHNRRGSWTH